MPVSYVGLTVSHLASARRFYEAALKPLGYRVIREERDQVAFGVADPDFFICEDPSRGRPSGTHIAFAAQSAAEVDAFYRAALAAGGRRYASPKFDGEGAASEYGTSVVDMDNNAIEVTSGPTTGHNVSRGQDTRQSNSDSSPLSRFPLQTIVNGLATTMTASADGPRAQQGSESKSIFGTLLGAAAGAAIAYAIAKDDSHRCDDHDGAVREIRVQHTVEYRRPSDDGPRSTYDNSPRHHNSNLTSQRSPLKIEPPRSEYSVESVQSSRTSRPRPAPLAITAPPSPPQSHAPSVADRGYAPSYSSSSRRRRSNASPRSYSNSPHEIPLPPSSRVSRSFRQPEDIPLPPSARESTTFRHSERYPTSPSTRSSSVRSPRDIPLPPSRRTSFLSRPPSPPRSERSARTSSTVRPLTKRNVERMNGDGRSEVVADTPDRGPSASEGARGHRGQELESVVPEDSISQISERATRIKQEGHGRREKRKEGHERREKRKEGRSKEGSSLGKDSARSSVKVFGFGG